MREKSIILTLTLFFLAIITNITHATYVSGFVVQGHKCKNVNIIQDIQKAYFRVEKLFKIFFALANTCTAVEMLHVLNRSGKFFQPMKVKEFPPLLSITAFWTIRPSVLNDRPLEIPCGVGTFLQSRPSLANVPPHTTAGKYSLYMLKNRQKNTNAHFLLCIPLNSVYFFQIISKTCQ